MRVSAIVVNWNAGEHLARCVHALLNQVDAAVEVIVVDNASSDTSLAGLCDVADRVQIVQTGENLGFGRGINRGVAAATNPFVVGLNPDVVLEANALGALVGFLEGNRDAGIVGPRLRDASGQVGASAGFAPRLADEICRKFLLHLIFPLFKFRRVRPDAAAEVDWVTGACFAARREVFDATGGMDEAIFMYYEDVDFCLRARRLGWQVWLVPEGVGRHLGGQSSKQALTRMLVVSEASYTYLIRHHLGRRASLLLLCLRPVEMVMRSLIWSAIFILQPNRREEARARLRAYFSILTGGVAKEAV